MVKRGDLYKVFKPGKSDPKKFRVFVVISRPTLIHSQFSTVICAPIYSRHDALSTQVQVGIPEGLKHESSIHCDELMSLPKSLLTDYVGTLSEEKIQEMNSALTIALYLED